eukprot:6435013-Karenia_brevis.AAC.1
MKVKYALQRRGIAYEVARLMTWETHEEVVDTYFRVIAEEPITGYAKVSWEQVYRADQELHSRLPEIKCEDLSLPGDGSLPLDNAVMK